MEIRLASPADLEELLAIFKRARLYMASQGNPNQWGRNNWPPREAIEQDIASKKSYVVIESKEIIGTFCLDFGMNPEPVYEHLEGGTWAYPGPYAVIHRIAAKKEGKGILRITVDFALEKAPHIRIDTHEDNLPMRHLLEKLGFAYRGIVRFDHDPYAPRLAYER